MSNKRKPNANKWIYNYSNLDPDNQLYVAEEIAKELKDNETTFNEDEYEKEKSKIVRRFFDSIINNAKQSEKLKKFADVFEKYEKLSQSNRKKVINEVFEIIAKYLDIQEQEDKEKVCQQEGHTFGKWRKITWTTKEVYWDAGLQGDVDVEREKWERKCRRCGCVEEVEQEPLELIEERKEKKRKARIKRLERELKELKMNNG